ncbi:hypothetical protein LAT59_02910 [Candidatus Gracilibacteria bacterium]|nr:hypothetical protein [Candidatus Gracilibacteria bacterium]
MDNYDLIYTEKHRFIFLSFEGFTYQPDSESTEPDIENMQVIGFSEGFSRKEAFQNLLKENEYIRDTTFDEVWCMRLADGGNYDSVFYIQKKTSSCKKSISKTPFFQNFYFYLR